MGIDFHIFKPQGRLSGQVQAIWSVAVAEDAPQAVTKHLLGDAGSGISFILHNQVQIEDQWFGPGALLLPVSTLAHDMTLMPGSVMAGVRFHPAVGYQLLGERLDTPMAIEHEHFLATDAALAIEALQTARMPGAQITTLYRWSRALFSLCPLSPTGEMVHRTDAVGLRQRERQFRQWLGITPKQYQRIMRVRQTLEQLRTQPDAQLAALALAQGFSDQAHMTRECKQIARVTPRQFVRRRRT